MRVVSVSLAVLAVLAAGSPRAQIGPPQDVLSFAIPIVIQTGSVEFANGSRSVTAGGGVTSPVPGFFLMDVDAAGDGRLARYSNVDVTGGVAAVACFALSCSGVPEQEDGTDTGDGWSFIDGVLLPRFDFGLLRSVGAGAVGGGAHLSASGAASTGRNGSLGWVDFGPQLAYGAQVGPATLIATATYTVGFEGGSQALTGRAVKVKADLVVPVGRFDAVATLSFDRRRDDRGSEGPDDDYAASFLTFGAGIGF